MRAAAPAPRHRGWTSRNSPGSRASMRACTTGLTTQASARACVTTSNCCTRWPARWQDRKSTRLNSSHPSISYAVFCLEKKTASVIRVFVDLYRKGKIYRGYCMVHWDPEAKTTLSAEEVNHEEREGGLYYLKYKIEGREKLVTNTTTRHETILGDTAVCINPNDERYKHLKGKKVVVPVCNRFFFYCYGDHRDLHSFPTRRSSDLKTVRKFGRNDLKLLCVLASAHTCCASEHSRLRRATNSDGSFVARL